MLTISGYWHHSLKFWTWYIFHLCSWVNNHHQCTALPLLHPETKSKHCYAAKTFTFYQFSRLLFYQKLRLEIETHKDERKNWLLILLDLFINFPCDQLKGFMISRVLVQQSNDLPKWYQERRQKIPRILSPMASPWLNELHCRGSVMKFQNNVDITKDGIMTVFAKLLPLSIKFNYYFKSHLKATHTKSHAFITLLLRKHFRCPGKTSWWISGFLFDFILALHYFCIFCQIKNQ